MRLEDSEREKISDRYEKERFLDQFIPEFAQKLRFKVGKWLDAMFEVLANLNYKLERYRSKRGTNLFKPSLPCAVSATFTFPEGCVSCWSGDNCDTYKEALR